MTKAETLERTLEKSKRLIAKAAANKLRAGNAIGLAKELNRTSAELRAELHRARKETRPYIKRQQTS